MQSVDINKLILGLRHELLAAEIVQLSGTTEFIGIRSGDYDPAIHIRPAATPTNILSATQFNDNAYSFDPDVLGYDMFVSEDYLPVYQGPSANDRNEADGIMQYSISVKDMPDGGVTDMALMYNTMKYIQEVFDPSLPAVVVDQYLNTGIDIDALTPGPKLIDEGWVTTPLSINLRSYIDEAGGELSGAVTSGIITPITGIYTGPGTFTLDAFNSNVMQGVRYDYSVLKSLNARTGSIMGAWDSIDIASNENSTMDVGYTGDITFTLENNAGSIELFATIDTASTYSVKLTRYSI